MTKTNTSNGNVIIDECPCIFCDLRDAECHGRCSAYSNWQKENEKLRELKNKKSGEDSFFKQPRKHRSVL